MTEYKRGQRVKVEFEGTVNSGKPVQVEGAMVYEVSDSDRYIHYVYLPRVAGPLDPPDWPPQVGDIWSADGREWYTREHSFDDLGIVVESFEHSESIGNHYQRGMLDEFKALNPVLVRRRGQ